MTKSSVCWDKDVYQAGRQLNRWPFDRLVSQVTKLRAVEGKGLQRVLEIGCGTGNNLWFLDELGLDPYGLESSSTAVHIAGEYLETRGCAATIVQGDLKELPWPSSFFDLVIDRGALTQNSHVDVRQALGESHRVLRRGGYHLSMTLFGSAHPDKQLGQPLGEGSYDHFSAGYFAGVGLTSFFDREELILYFEKFSHSRIRRFVEYDDNGEIQSDEYEVLATK